MIVKQPLFRYMNRSVNPLSAGCDTCQRITGHKAEKTFRDYIDLSSDELKIDEFPSF